jgi:hypothetical protein
MLVDQSRTVGQVACNGGPQISRDRVSVVVHPTQCPARGPDVANFQGFNLWLH